MPGLLRGVARTAVIAGTATTVSNRVSRRQGQRWAQQEEQQQQQAPVAAPAPADWTEREKYPETFVIDELRCIYCGMCEEACPVDAIELTTLADLTGLSREQMIFDKEKLLSVWDETTRAGTDPVRTSGGKLGPAASLPVSGNEKH